MRPKAWTVWACLVAGLGAFVVCGLLAAASAAPSQRLLRLGTTASATVVERNDATGDDTGGTVVVEFTVPGETGPRRAEMNVTNPHGYLDREQLTIYYDPAEPSHVRTQGAENVDGWQADLAPILFLLGLVLVVGAFILVWARWDPRGL